MAHSSPQHIIYHPRRKLKPAARKNIYEVTREDIDIASGQVQDLCRNLSPDLIYSLGDTPKDLAHLNKFRIQTSNSEAIREMLAAACSARWGDMFSILDDNPFIINCIANDRAWGAIHQAAYFNEIDVVRRLLEIPFCDPFLKTKQDRREYSGPGKTADSLTTNPMIKRLIKTKQTIRKNEVKKLRAPTFVEVNNEYSLEIRTVLLALASFHMSLYPKAIESDNSLTFSQLMQDVFEYIDTGDQWKIARRDVGYQLQVLGLDIGNCLLTSDSYFDIPSERTQTKESFYKRVIQMYTSIKLTTSAHDPNNPNPILESRLFYSCLNRSLRTEGNQAKPTLGEDLAFTAYGILLNAILMYWPRLKPVTAEIYRGLSMDTHHLSKYRINTQFSWLDFTSASLDKKVARMYSGEKVVFIIRNPGISKCYSGKYISNDILVEDPEEHFFENYIYLQKRNFMEHTHEEEVLIPNGANFFVKNVQKLANGLTCIYVEMCDF